MSPVRPPYSQTTTKPVKWPWATTLFWWPWHWGMLGNFFEILWNTVRYIAADIGRLCALRCIWIHSQLSSNLFYTLLDVRTWNCTTFCLHKYTKLQLVLVPLLHLACFKTLFMANWPDVLLVSLANYSDKEGKKGENWSRCKWGRRRNEGRETSSGVACKASLIRWWAVQCFSPDAYMH